MRLRLIALSRISLLLRFPGRALGWRGERFHFVALRRLFRYSNTPFYDFLTSPLGR